MEGFSRKLAAELGPQGMHVVCLRSVGSPESIADVMDVHAAANRVTRDQFRPAFAASRLFQVWNLPGILDLVVAVSTGVLSSGFISGFAGEVTTAPMAELPLVLIPAYFVPLFIMLHLAALFQARRRASSMD